MIDIEEIDYNSITNIITENFKFYKKENYNIIINKLKKLYEGNYENFAKSYYNELAQYDNDTFNNPSNKDIVYVKEIIKICFDIFKGDENSYKYYILCYVIYWLYFNIIDNYTKYDNEYDDEYDENLDEEHNKQRYMAELYNYELEIPNYIYTNFMNILNIYNDANKYEYLLYVQILQTNENLLKLNCSNYYNNYNYIMLYNCINIFSTRTEGFKQEYKFHDNIFTQVKTIALFETVNFLNVSFYVNKIKYEPFENLLINNNINLNENVIPPGEYNNISDMYIDFRILQD